MPPLPLLPPTSPGDLEETKRQEPEMCLEEEASSDWIGPGNYACSRVQQHYLPRMPPGSSLWESWELAALMA